MPLPRTFWTGVVGYDDEATRDQVLADFAASIDANAQYLTPATWDAQPTIPAGITSPATVFERPGFTYGFDVSDGFERTDAWCAIVDAAYGPSQVGTYQIAYLP